MVTQWIPTCWHCKGMLVFEESAKPTTPEAHVYSCMRCRREVEITAEELYRPVADQYKEF